MDLTNSALTIKAIDTNRPLQIKSFWSSVLLQLLMVFLEAKYICGDFDQKCDEEYEDDSDANDERIVHQATVVVIFSFLLLVDCVKRIVT